MGSRFVFVGNRRFVLEQMILEGLDLTAVFVVGGTHLERDLNNGLLPKVTNWIVVGSKAELLSQLEKNRFDVLVSNGCPYILPISDLPAARYVNIHPSFLPDLRGADPTIGAILLERDTGATCHVMDAGIDTGPIIAQVRIPYSDDLDATTLYQLSFIAEKRVFSRSLARDFQPAADQEEVPGLIYYSRKGGDRMITFTEPNDLILRKIRAFNNRSQGCEFVASGGRFRVFSARLMHNPFLAEIVTDFPALTVALIYENSIAFHKDGQVMRFDSVQPDGNGAMAIGDRLLSA
jgi:methionyl-tRNA formyltransferase